MGVMVEGAGRDGGLGGRQRDGERQGGSQGGPPNFGAAAATLGIAQQELMDALGGPPSNFAAAAATSGISKEKMQEALDDQDRAE